VRFQAPDAVAARLASDGDRKGRPMAKIARIYRYPIKGLSAEALHPVELAAGIAAGSQVRARATRRAVRSRATGLAAQEPLPDG
jgi:hypothetical protein